MLGEHLSTGKQHGERGVGRAFHELPYTCQVALVTNAPPVPLLRPAPPHPAPLDTTTTPDVHVRHGACTAVEGVTIYFSDFKRNIVDKLQKDFFAEPSRE